MKAEAVHKNSCEDATTVVVEQMMRNAEIVVVGGVDTLCTASFHPEPF